MFFVYVLKSKKDGNLYFGYASDLKRRFKMHNAGKVKSTKERLPFDLVYYEAYKSEKDARSREIQLKKMGSQRESLKKKLQESLE